MPLSRHRARWCRIASIKLSGRGRNCHPLFAAHALFNRPRTKNYQGNQTSTHQQPWPDNPGNTDFVCDLCCQAFHEGTVAAGYGAQTETIPSPPQEPSSALPNKAGRKNNQCCNGQCVTHNQIPTSGSSAEYRAAKLLGNDSKRSTTNNTRKKKSLSGIEAGQRTRPAFGLMAGMLCAAWYFEIASMSIWANVIGIADPRADENRVSRPGKPTDNGFGGDIFWI